MKISSSDDHAIEARREGAGETATKPRAQALFAEPLYDLGAEDARFRGIWAPRSEIGAAKRGVTAQFLEDAGEYDRRYTDVAHFRKLIDDALEVACLERDPAVILDIGSGSGNSVLPLLDRFPGAFVVATDISPQLLAILRRRLEQEPRYRDRYALVCMDACGHYHRAGAFDLAVGAAILHHIIEPQRILGACARALRPGGAAIFFEPFELGHSVLRLAYAQIVAEAARRRVRSRGIDFLKGMIADFALRIRDKSEPVFLHVDDKWLFTRAFFERATANGMWQRCLTYAIDVHDQPLREHTRSYLKLGIDADETALPRWAWDKLEEFEAAFSPATRKELMFSGTIVSIRGPAAFDAGLGDVSALSGWWWNPQESGRGFFIEFGPQASVLSCLYAEDGRPVWYCAGPVEVGPECELSANAHPFRIPGAAPHDDEETQPPAIQLRPSGVSTLQLDWGESRIPLSPQHAALKSARADGSSATGWWVDDPQAPSCAVVCEDLDEVLVCAYLTGAAWVLAAARRRAGPAHVGEWRRYSGGQTLTGPYRGPPRSEPAGEASIARSGASLRVKLPDGRVQLFHRWSARART